MARSESRWWAELPEPVLGAIVIVAVRGFLRVDTMRMCWQRDRPAFAIAGTAMPGVLVFDLLPGLIVSVGLSRLLFIAYASAPKPAVLAQREAGAFVDSVNHPGLRQIPGLLILRPDGGLFFGNANRVRHAITDLAAAHASGACRVPRAQQQLPTRALGAGQSEGTRRGPGAAAASNCGWRTFPSTPGGSSIRIRWPRH